MSTPTPDLSAVQQISDDVYARIVSDEHSHTHLKRGRKLSEAEEEEVTRQLYAIAAAVRAEKEANKLIAGRGSSRPHSVREYVPMRRKKFTDWRMG